jgi:SAM-dependent methyltransferase
MSQLTSSPQELKTQHCPLCEVETAYLEVYRKWGYPILRCKECGLGATDTGGRFDAESYYNEGYFHGAYVDGYSNYTSSEAVLRAEFRKLLRRCRKLGPRHGRLLEIGCAYGYLLEEAVEWYSCTGLELCPEAVASCRRRGLDVAEGQLTQEFVEGAGSFDVIAMLDVIEHLPEPAETLARAAAATRPGGLLVITTGDWNSLLSRVLGSRWRLMTPPQHLYFFSRRTLIRLVEKAGFTVVEAVHPWKSVPLGLAVYQLTRRLGLRLPLPGWLNRLGVPVNLFDAVRLVARKEAG